MDNNNEYTYNVAAQEESYEASGYTTASKPEPATRVSKASKSRFSTAARVCMWIVGSIAGLTVIFTCVLVWISGLQFLGVIEASKSDAAAEGTVPSGDTYNFYVYDDTFSNQLPSGGFEDGSGSAGGDEFEDYFDDFIGGNDGSEQIPNSGEGEDTQPQSGAPGLGITIVQLELQFAIDDKYTAGLVINSIEDYSSFIGTEVQINDMIVAAEGEPTPTPDDLKKHFEGKSVGDELTLTIARYKDGVAATFDVTVKLIEMQG